MSTQLHASPASGDEPVYQTWVDDDGDAPMTYGVITAVETATNRDHIDIQLSEMVDPEALDQLYRHARQQDEASWEIEFMINQYEVAVRSDGRITIHDCNQIRD